MTDHDQPGADDAELRARWARRGAPAVMLVPDEAITGRTQDRIDVAVDEWLSRAVARGDED